MMRDTYEAFDSNLGFLVHRREEKWQMKTSGDQQTVTFYKLKKTKNYIIPRVFPMFED